MRQLLHSAKQTQFSYLFGAFAGCLPQILHIQKHDRLEQFRLCKFESLEAQPMVVNRNKVNYES